MARDTLESSDVLELCFIRHVVVFHSFFVLSFDLKYLSQLNVFYMSSLYDTNIELEHSLNLYPEQIYSFYLLFLYTLSRFKTEISSITSSADIGQVHTYVSLSKICFVVWSTVFLLCAVGFSYGSSKVNNKLNKENVFLCR